MIVVFYGSIIFGWVCTMSPESKRMALFTLSSSSSPSSSLSSLSLFFLASCCACDNANKWRFCMLCFLFNVVVVFLILGGIFTVDAMRRTLNQETAGRGRMPSLVEAYFIDPDARSFQRKFYSSGLAPKLDLKSESRIPLAHVTIFQASSAMTNNCVPLYTVREQALTICVYPSSEDHVISSQLRDEGTWEKEHLRAITDVLQSQPGEMMTLVDVGCNVGVYTLTAASLGHRVLALDVVASNLQLLHQSLLLTNLTQRVTVLHNAVAHQRRRFSVHVEKGNIGGSSLLPYAGSNSSAAVWSVCLDDLIPYVRTKAVVLKMDIEGWEERVLRCAGDFFQTFDVRAVQMEWLFHRHTPAASVVINFMLRNGLLPFEHGLQHAVLPPNGYFAWPDNIMWIKR